MTNEEVLKKWQTLYFDDLLEEGAHINKTHSIQDPEQNISRSNATFVLFDEESSPEEQSIHVENSPFGGFRVSREIGRGGVGLIEAATQDSLQREVAIKTTLERRMQGSLVQEAMITGALSHPNIMSIYELIYGTDGKIAIAMPLVEGRPWCTSRKEGNLSLEEELDILIRVALAVEYAHSCGVLHNDIKMENVYFSYRFRVMLFGFQVHG